MSHYWHIKGILFRFAIDGKIHVVVGIAYNIQNCYILTYFLAWTCADAWFAEKWHSNLKFRWIGCWITWQENWKWRKLYFAILFASPCFVWYMTTKNEGNEEHGHPVCSIKSSNVLILMLRLKRFSFRFSWYPVYQRIFVVCLIFPLYLLFFTWIFTRPLSNALFFCPAAT